MTTWFNPFEHLDTHVESTPVEVVDGSPIDDSPFDEDVNDNAGGGLFDTDAAPPAAVPSPPAAPAAGTDTDAVDEDADRLTDHGSTGDEPQQPEAPQPRGLQTHHYRQLKALLMVGATAAAAVIVAVPHQGQSLSLGTASTSTGHANSAETLRGTADSDQARLAQQLARTGTTSGYVPVPAEGQTARIAAAGTSAVMSRQSADGTCLMYGMSDGQPTTIAQDATGSACTDAEVALAQQTLDQVADAGAQALTDSLDQTLRTAVVNLVQYKSMSTTQGDPVLDGVQLTAVGGGYVLKATQSGACRMLAVTADYSATDPAPCS